MKTTQRLLTLAAALLLTASNLSAQETPTPEFPSYYAAADGKKGAELKTALCAIIRPHTQRTYKELWTDFYTTDVRVNDQEVTVIWDMYSNTTNYVPGSSAQGANYKKEGDSYNREHSWPKSWFNDAYPMYTDLYHLYPTDGWVNNKRGNYPFGETDGAQYGNVKGYKSDNDFSKLGANTYPGYEGVVFEPNDIYKGDFARTYFYMVTCYENEIVNDKWYDNVESQPTIDGTKYPAFQSWQLSMLMKWAQNDPVDNPIAKETPRNNEVAKIQKNRNPFIDYPGLEEYIWGSYMDVPFSYNNYQQPTAITTLRTDRTMHNGVMYNMAGQVVDKSFKGLVIMNGKKYLNR